MRVILAFLLAALALDCAAIGIGNPGYTAAFCVPTAAAAPEFPSADLSEYWPMQEAVGNSRVDVVNLVNFTETTGTVDSTTGKNGNAANWAPSTGTLDSSIGLGDFGGTWTVSFWINIDNAPGATILVQGGSGSENIEIHLTSGRELRFETTSDGLLLSSAALALDTWHHVCMTLSGAATWTVYINGSSIGSAMPTNPPDDAAIILGTVTDLDAAIDEYGIWTRVLSGTEISNIWNGGTGTFYTPP